MTSTSSFFESILIAVLCTALAGCANCGEPDPDPPADDAGETADDGGDRPDGGGDGADSDAGSVDPNRALIEGVEETATFTIPALQAPVHVVRTEMNVPHIYASNRHDLYVAEGFVMARDRYFEFEIGRRLGAGRIAELLGDFGLAVDMQSRGQGMTHVADRIFENLDDETGAYFDAYAEGINAYIAGVKDGTFEAPSEFVKVQPLLGVAKPADAMFPVTRRDVLGFAAVAVFTSSFEDTDLVRSLAEAQIPGHFDGAPFATLREAGLGPDIWAPIAPVHDISVVPGFGLNGSVQQIRSHVVRDVPLAYSAPLAEPMVQRVLRRSERMRGWFRAGHTGDRGSNAWAVGPSGTPDGSTLLAGDGHLAIGLPPLFYQMGLDLSVFGGDDGDFSVLGLFLPGFPFTAVGTNGHIAWSQTYPRADVMDWYREEIRLDADGRPAESLFDGEWKPLVEIEETYQLGGALASEDEVTWSRWTTFDGRFLQEIEGRTVEDPEDEELAAGEAVVTMLGDFVVPGDVDGDGKISAVSLDFTAYDVGNLGATVAGFQEARSVEEFQSGVAKFIGYAQNMVAVDAEGHIGFTPFTATPCRENLERLQGVFTPGADPALLLDGTRFGAFEIPVDETGTLDIEAGAGDAARCVIPVDHFPTAYDPEDGWVSTANNDPAGGSFDDTWANDLHYIGGPWVPGYRALAIKTELERLVADRSATLEAMQQIQAGHRSMVGEEYTPLLLDAIRLSRNLSQAPQPLAAHEQRVADLWDERFTEVESRLEAWVAAGASAESGVSTFYQSPTDQDRVDAAATMIFNAWFREYLNGVIGDEEIDFLFLPVGRQRSTVMRMMKRFHDGRGAGNPRNLASWNDQTGESVYFDDLNTPEVERSEEVMLRSLVAALDMLASEEGIGFGTDDMSQWLWGLRHMVRFESLLAEFTGSNAAIGTIARQFSIDTSRIPLADDLAEDDPRADLRWFPRDGDLLGVDAANPSFFGDDFTYGTGPVMRMVIELGPDGRVRGENIIPGGQSGLTSSEHYDDQVRLWLGNETLPMRYHVEDVVAGATGRETLLP